MIITTIAPAADGRKAVAVILGPGDVFLTAEGNPMSGVALYPATAREVAYRMLYLAQLIENGKDEPHASGTAKPGRTE